MSNVVRLSERLKLGNPVGPVNVKIAQANVLAMSVELDRAIKTLSKQFEAIEYVIDSLNDPESRKLQDRLRESLTIASSELSQAIRKFSSFGKRM
jgi:GTP-sensing pleiotropic transcriptional regulator CodY